MAEAPSKQVTDGRMVEVETWIPDWPKQVGGGEEAFNNQSEEKVIGAGDDDEIGNEEGEG